MTISGHDVLLVDAANTIIHKPLLWQNFCSVLERFGYRVGESELRKKHKLISEIIDFPDRTSQEFYRKFNAEVLLSLGIIPSDNLLEAIFGACTYLPWVTFDDVSVLASIPIRKMVLSNFNSSLRDTIYSLTGDIFDDVIVSEEEGVRKPDERFYQVAIERIGADPERILYVGDSIKLDMIPAFNLGMDAWLIDRDENFPYFIKRLKSFEDLIQRGK